MRTYSNELYHYGVLGMKWGVRKARSYAQDTSGAGAAGTAYAVASHKSKSRTKPRKRK